MSSTRSPNGFGTLKRRKNGLYEARIWVTLPDGRRKRVSKYSRKKQDCQQWLLEMRYRHAKGELMLASDTPFLEYLEQWMRDFCINIRPATLGNYRQYLKHIQEHPVGQTPLSKLTTVSLQNYIRYLQQKGRLDGKGGLSNKTVRNLMLMIHQALKQAVGCNLIPRNPADYLVLPKCQNAELEVLDTDELRRLILAGVDDSWGISLVLLATTGLRLGELLALRYDSVRMHDDILFLDITATFQRIPNINRQEGEPQTVLQLGPPKSRNGVRMVPLAPEAVELLKWHMIRQQEQAAAFDEHYRNNPFIICNGAGGPIEPSRYRKWFKSVVQRAGITRRVYPHLLRHTWASMALQAEVDLKNLSDTLGHFDTAFSCRRYVHASLEGRAAALSKMQAIFANFLPVHDEASASS